MAAAQELTPAQAAEAVKDAVGGWGFTWMSDPGVRARGKAELGLRGRPLYHLGRGGALGDVPVDVVVAAEAFIPAEVVRAAWEEGRAVLAPLDAARAYAGYCSDVFRERYGSRPDLARLVELLEPVVDGAQGAGLALFAAWRALPRPDDAPGRAGLLLNVLREHRGSVHIAACAAMGLSPLESIMASSYGEASARFFEWPEPYPDPTPFRARRDAAEDLTAAAAGRPYDVLTAAQRGELVSLINRTLQAEPDQT